MSTTRKSIVIVQEYIPEYRRRFLELLKESLTCDGHDLSIVVGETPPHGSARGDAVVDRTITEVRSRRLKIGHRYLSYRKVRPFAKAADLVIADQQLRQIETHLLLFRQRAGGAPTALWGHGGSFSSSPNKVDRWLMRKMTNRAHWFFAYTSAGGAAVVDGGFPADAVTVVGNASDTEDLIRWRESVTPDEMHATRERLGLGDGQIGLYVGALEEAKKISYLLDAGAEIARRSPSFRLVVCGSGPLSEFIAQQASECEWLRAVGRSTGRDKVGVAACADVMMIPARVGLVAVDALALGLPLVTAMRTGHGPEFGFLQEGRTTVVAPGTSAEYADGVVTLLQDEARLRKMSQSCTEDAALHTVAAMVDSFTKGIHLALQQAG